MREILFNLGRRLLGFLRANKFIVQISLDFLLCCFSVWVSYCLRVGALVPLFSSNLFVLYLLSFTLIPVLFYYGFYKSIIRYSDVFTLLIALKAFVPYFFIFIVLVFFIGIDGIPRTVSIIHPVILFILIAGTRFSVRLLYSMYIMKGVVSDLTPCALIYGAGNVGRQLAVALSNSPDIRVVGFLDDDETLQGNKLNGLEIFNPILLKNIVDERSIKTVLLAIPNASRARRNEVLNLLKRHKVAVRTLPGVSDMALGKSSFQDIRELDIDDLLGRDPVLPDASMMMLAIKNNTVLVTGAGGSIGSELCRQILNFSPKRLLLLDVNEYALYRINEELLGVIKDKKNSIDIFHESNGIKNIDVASFDVEIIPLLASVCDGDRIDSIMKTWMPSTVYHAAAYKHVPLVEHNPIEGLRNNIWGTFVCAKSAERNHVKNFVLISTDKAVRPTNLMGATKRVAELILQASACDSTSTIYSIVRFGNVLGSSGSVVPLFRDQIKKGGPITITHTEITRYFMSIPEAAQLVIQAGAMGVGGDVFVLEMGEPVKIIDLARRMVELSGLSVKDFDNPLGEIELCVTELRPGEKMYEELLIGSNSVYTDHPRILRAQEQFFRWTELNEALDNLNKFMCENNFPKIKSILAYLVSGYSPDEPIVDWIFLANSGEK